MNINNTKFNGTLKKRMVQGSAGIVLIVLVTLLSPIINGHDMRLVTVEKKQECLKVKVETLEKLPDKLDSVHKEIESLRDEIKSLEKLLILCNKDNPDLVKYLELNK